MPKISIIIPVYNTEKYLNECIDSILKQPYDDYELILVDDGSYDRSLHICEEYASNHQNISVIHQKNSGVSVARNTGMMAATGKYLMFIDSDDYITDNCLLDIDKIIENTNVDLIIGKFETHSEGIIKPIKDCELDVEFINGKPANKVLEYIMDKNFLYTVWRYIFKNDLVKKGELYFLEGIYHEDEEWAPRLLCVAESFWLLEKPFYCYRKRKGSITGITTLKHNIDKIIVIEALNLYGLKSDDETHRRLMHKRAYNLLIYAFRQYFEMESSEKTAFHEYISTKRKILLTVISYNEFIYKYLLLMKPFFDILFPYPDND